MAKTKTKSKIPRTGSNRLKLSKKLRAQKSNNKVSKFTRQSTQRVQQESKLDLELEIDYQVPEKLQISNEDMDLFAALTAAPEQEKARRKISEQLDLLDKQQVLEDPSKDAEVRAVYTKVGQLLSKYRDGKVPECFSILPRVAHWENLVKITRPENWTVHAFFKATKIFVASPESKHTLHFFKYYLLPKCLKNISERGKLNYHLFQALRKAIFRPSLWFRGILFPFLKGQFNPEYKPGVRFNGNVLSLGTIKQSQIISAVLMKCSVPNVHASAAFLKVMELPYTGPVGVLVKLFIDKKFALPLSVIKRITQWFLNFGKNSQLEEEDQKNKKKEKMTLPVLWFQSLLSFGKGYYKYLNEAEIMALKKLVRKKFKHEALSKEIIQVLTNLPKLDNKIVSDNQILIEENS
jgi:essential nuclear protein 1